MPCYWIAIVGGTLYPVRNIVETCQEAKDPQLGAVPTWMLRLALCLWLVATIEAKDNALDEVCRVTVNFELAVIMQYIKILPECVILFIFMEQIITLHRGSKGIQDGNNHWRRGLINSGITFLVIVSEIMVGLITIRQRDYREFSQATTRLLYNAPPRETRIKFVLTFCFVCLLLIFNISYVSPCHVFHDECISGNSGRVHCRGYKDNIPETERMLRDRDQGHSSRHGSTSQPQE